MSKKSDSFEIEVKWQSRPEGRALVVRAVEKGTKKVLARVTTRAWTVEGDDLRVYLGEQGLKALETSASELCASLARGQPG